MKKLMLIGLSATALLATSCSNDEPVNMPQRQKTIGFSTFVDKSVRANEPVTADVTSDNLTSFKVWCVESKTEDGVERLLYPFKGHIVNFDRNNNIWIYAPLVYWDNGAKYTFMAVAPSARIATNDQGNNPISVTPATELNSYGSVTFKNIVDNPVVTNGTTDLVVAVDGTYAATGVNTSSVSTVALNFQHMLSRVVFEFTNAMEDGSTLVINNIMITNAYKEGTATIAAGEGNTAKPTWTATGSGNLLFGPSTKADGDRSLPPIASDDTETQKAAKRGKTEERYLIPSGSNDYNVTFSITRTQPSGAVDTYTKSATVKALDGEEWQPGYSYKFSATLNGANISPDGLKPIEFSGQVSTWTDASSDPTVSTVNQ